MNSITAHYAKTAATRPNDLGHTPPERAPDTPAPEPQAKATEPTEPGIQLVTPLMEAVALKYPFYMNALKRKINENWSPPGAGFAQKRDLMSPTSPLLASCIIIASPF